MRRTRILAPVFVAVAIGAGAGAGCKGKANAQDRPETLEKVKSLEQQLADKDTYIQKLRDANAELERRGGDGGGGGAPGEWVFVIEGDALVIKVKPGKGPAEIDDATATAMSKQFIDLVGKSRGAIQKCYEQALKKSTGLQGRTVTLTLSASFAASGTFSRVSFSPDLPEAFDTCLRGVASKWKMPSSTQAMTFQASVKLTPT